MIEETDRERVERLILAESEAIMRELLAEGHKPGDLTGEALITSEEIQTIIRGAWSRKIPDVHVATLAALPDEEIRASVRALLEPALRAGMLIMPRSTGGD